MYASGPAIARRAQEASHGRENDLISRLAGGHRDRITAETVRQAAIAGDQSALILLQETAEYLGLGLANAANLLNPELIVLGGGVACGWGELLLKPVEEVVRRRAMSLNNKAEIRIARLGELAGAVGAAQIARLKFLLGRDFRTLYW